MDMLSAEERRAIIASRSVLDSYSKRKVSQSLITIALNDDYEGGDFVVEEQVIPQKVGTAVQIPQHALDKSKNFA